MELLQQIKTWMSTQPVTVRNLSGNISKKGFRILLLGSSSDEKNITIKKISEEFNKPIHRVDVSKIINRYIGETEKNIEQIFDLARVKDVILFFDEADALFGKRTGVKDSHDKYANQEVSYLMQQLEKHPGISILAFNLKQNIDPAFTRRFNSIIHTSKT